MRCRWRRCHQRQTGERAGGIDPGQSTHGGGFCIAFDANQLTGKEQRPSGLALQGIQEQLGRVDERVPVQTTIA